MNERELLELAAHAAGIELIAYHSDDEPGYEYRVAKEIDGNTCHLLWDPITDDGTALRLAVQLKLQVLLGQGPAGDITWVRAPDELDIEGQSERQAGDPFAAARLAIVRTAAEIGRNHS